MDYMEKITELRAQKKGLKDQADALVQEGKIEEASALADQMEVINKQIAGMEALAEASREHSEPVYDGVLHDGSGSDSWSDADAPPPLWSESLPSDPPAHASSSHLLVPALPSHHAVPV